MEVTEGVTSLVAVCVAVRVCEDVLVLVEEGVTSLVAVCEGVLV